MLRPYNNKWTSLWENRSSGALDQVRRKLDCTATEDG